MCPAQAWELGVATPAATGHLSGACSSLQDPKDLQAVRPCQGHTLLQKKQPALSTHSSFLGQLRVQTRALGRGCGPAMVRDSEMPTERPPETGARGSHGGEGVAWFL